MKNLISLYFALFATIATPDIAWCNDPVDIPPIKTVAERKISKHVFGKKYRKALSMQGLVSFVDYSLPIDEKRFFVFDVRERKVIFSTYVGHSRYSGRYRPIKTSNVPNTKKTSLGLYRVGAQYHGRFGKSKRLHGLSKTNDNAFRRAIVAHSMPGRHVSDLYSWGCFTFFKGDLNVVFHFMRRGSYLLVLN